MRIDSSTRIAHPLERVYRTYRDDLSSLAAYLPDISRIEVESRTERDDGVDLLNVWYASTPIPSVATGFVRPEMLRWEDHASWDDENTLARWTLVVPALRNQVRCTGETRLSSAGPEHTTVALVGELDIDLRKIPGVNRFLAKTMKSQVEAFISRLIAPNLRRVNAALEQYLNDQYP